MIIHLGECPVCEQPLSYEARLCPHCGQPFDKYGSFGDFVVAEQVERERREAEEAQRRAKKTFNVILFFVVTLLILAVVVLLYIMVQHVSPDTAIAAKNRNTFQFPLSTPTASLGSTAKTTIKQYYDDVNSQNYLAAYNMWAVQGESLADFVSGYSHTKQDGLDFGNVVLQPDGTIKVFVTVYATELTPSGGTKLSTYKGYYIVGQRGGEWKILDGVLNHA